MLRWRSDSCRDFVTIRGEYGLLVIRDGNLSPHGLGALATAIADVNGDDWTTQGIHGNPGPLPIRLLPDTAPELVHLGFQPMQDHPLSADCRLDIQRLGCGPESLTPTLQQPPEAHPYRTADPAQRESLQPQSLDQRALLFRDAMIFWN